MSAHARSAPRPAASAGIDRVTGGQQYVADIHLPDVLHAKLVTLDCARARIISIDTSAAERVPGVRLVMTAADLPQPVPRFGPQFEDRPVLAVGETKYHGEPVAAVAADTKDAAEEAARLVRVEYEELPAVFTIAGGARPGRAARPGPGPPPGRPPRRHERPPRAPLRLGRRRRRRRVGRPRRREHLHVPDGDPLRHRAARVHGRPRRGRHRRLEHASSTRTGCRRSLAKILGLPLSKVRVFAPDPGGGFGGKQHAKLRAARRLHGPPGRPAGAPGPDPRGDVPGGPPERRPRSASGPGSARTARSSSRTSRPTT